ncbi:DUF3795 domain-containing protein [candidate division WOR-3 bacterium]|jgi:hypothetical protein|nr:DUF3795 domain-containing protein [candidate division WOR-3 bacterium]
MERMVASCGLTCSKCPAFIAKKENNDELRKKTAEEWSKQFNAEMKPEDINCDGCITDGEHINYCNICEIRKCGIEKKIQNCAYCDDYICEKLEKWFKNVPDAKTTLEEIRRNK